MVAVSTNFEIDDDVLQEFNEIAMSQEQSQIINDLLKDYIKQIKIKQLNQAIMKVRHQAKPLKNGLTTTDLIRQLRDGHE